ncbi:hypothetical protein [Methanococcoides sp. AM1]|uniref:hypothetical protein n=1 Tax=Methanococcoides sp. AM1 TaxID=1201011 RepID=UPI0010831715|nr:hypothetical protein [Methanococcoides sp. AM1]
MSQIQSSLLSETPLIEGYSVTLPIVKVGTKAYSADGKEFTLTKNALESGLSRGKMISRTDSGYPHFLALGWCSHSCEEVIVCRVGNWRLRLMHEVGHEVGMEHVRKKGFLMHPWGFRGENRLL